MRRRPINLIDPCPCKSGRTFEECCLSPCRVEEDPSTLVRLHFKLLDPGGFAARVLEHPFFAPGEERGAPLFKWVEMVAAQGTDTLGFTWRTGRVLGVLWLSSDRATLECLGRLRAEKGRAVLTNIFGKTIRFLAATYQDPDNVHLPAPLRPDSYKPYPGLKEGHPRSHYLENHWIHEPNQALGGLSPLTCARKRSMRPKLAGLLVDLKERGGESYDFDRLARLLGVEKLVVKMGMEDKIDRLRQRMVILMDSLFRFIRVLEESDVDPALLDAGKLSVLLEMESSLKEAAVKLEDGLPSRLKELEGLLGGMENMESSFFGLMHEIIDPIPQRDEIIQRFNDPDFNHHAAKPAGSPFSRELFDLAVDEAASQLERQWRAAWEKKELSRRISLSAALGKLPAQWVEAVYLSLGLVGDTTKRERIAKIARFLVDEEILEAVVKTLTPGGLDALRHALKRGGVASYPGMARLFGTEENDGFYWAERAPQSILGRLRARGLIFVGRVKRGSRLYRSVVIPKELREPLALILLK